MNELVPLAGVGAGIVGATVLTPLLAAPALNAVGFSAAGPVAGTIAAWVQSWIGNVAAGSVFAAVQGVAMGAGIPVFVKVIGGAITGVVWIAVTAVFSYL